MDITERREIALAVLGTEGNPKPRNRSHRPLKTFLKARPLMSKRREYFTCAKKARYKTQSDATRAANKAKTERGVLLRSYYCGNCKGFHLTKCLTRRKPLEAR